MDTTYFIDFDGTITTEDTTAAMTRAFVAAADIPAIMKINALWEQKKLSTRECAQRVFHYFQADLDDMLGLLETVEIDPGFLEFMDIRRSENEQVYVLSDGFDLGIRTVFKKYGLDLPFYSNTMLYDDGFQVECPHSNPQCGHCGVCKTSLLQGLKEPGHKSVYIGDGYSDLCPAGHADMVFAKEPLYSLCRRGGVHALRFSSFREIEEKLHDEPPDRGAFK